MGHEKRRRRRKRRSKKRRQGEREREKKKENSLTQLQPTRSVTQESSFTWDYSKLTV